jgi:hypothetical protein
MRSGPGNAMETFELPQARIHLSKTNPGLTCVDVGRGLQTPPGRA